MGLTALDIMALLALGAGAVFGLMRGFVVEVFSLVAWVAGFIAVKLFAAPVTNWLAGPVGTTGGATLLSVALLFGIAFVVVRTTGSSVGARARKSVLGPIDRILGMGFGMLKGLLAVTLAFLIMTLVGDTINGGPTKRPEWMTRSASYDLLRASSEALVAFVEARRKATA